MTSAKAVFFYFLIPYEFASRFSLAGLEDCEYQLMRSSALHKVGLYRVKGTLILLRGFCL